MNPKWTVSVFSVESSANQCDEEHFISSEMPSGMGKGEATQQDYKVSCNSQKGDGKPTAVPFEIQEVWTVSMEN